MAITDNTAKWQVKKLTNFTDKEREIATQAQAEEGVDNTKVMTPLRSKQLGDKNYLKLSGGTLTGSLKTNASIFNFSKSVDGGYTQISSGITTTSGAVLILRNNNHSSNAGCFTLQTGAIGEASAKTLLGNTNGNLVWNGQKVFTTEYIATQSQAEAGTDNATVMTPLRVKNAIDKQRPLKTFTETSQLGLDMATFSLADLYNAMGEGTMFSRGFTPEYSVNLDLPPTGHPCQFLAWKATNRLTCLATNEYGEQYIRVYSFWSDTGWKKLATNGALSMPSGNRVDVSIENGGTYTAPCDGWFQVKCAGSSNGSYIVLINNQANMFTNSAYHTTGPIYANIPVAKGQTIALNCNTAVEQARFIYAQSEV